MSFERLLDRAFGDDPLNPLAETRAVVIAVDGEVVAERYGPEDDTETTFLSWSMAKSVTSALVGIAVGDGLLDIDAPAEVDEWSADGDPRGAITLRQLLEMRSGLAWTEDYVDESVSDVIDMLFGSGKGDTAGFAAAKPLAHPPGEQFLYSSGTTNIVARALGAALTRQGTSIVDFARTRLFEPVGMNSATLRTDAAGTFIGSSFAYATARDFLAFGELYRNDGVVAGRRILPTGWVQASTRQYSVDAESSLGYGLHWWRVRDQPSSYAASGYEGQRIQVCPDRGLTFVRLGRTPAERDDVLTSFYADIVAASA